MTLGISACIIMGTEGYLNHCPGGYSSPSWLKSTSDEAPVFLPRRKLRVGEFLGCTTGSASLQITRTPRQDGEQGYNVWHAKGISTHTRDLHSNRDFVASEYRSCGKHRRAEVYRDAVMG
jgi:hypothetical protein